jgi:hypothetical protein
MLAMTLHWQVREHLSQDQEELRLPLSIIEIETDAWWQTEWRQLPRQLTRFSSVAARDFNFQVAADPGQLASELANDGWYTDEAADWTWVIRALDPDPEPAALPLLGKDHLGRPEVLRLRRFNDETGQHQTLRLWDSGVRLMPGGQVLYAGQAAEENMVRRLKALFYWRSMPAAESTLGDIADSLGRFSTRQVAEGLMLVRNKAQEEDQRDR